MVQAQHEHAAATLRGITNRISLTPTGQLPQIASTLAGQLWSCKDLLSSPAHTTKSGNEGTRLVHQFRSSLSSLLQDRLIEGRWSAIILVKASIEAGGVETLAKSGPWIKNLLSVLKKPDPPTTRVLAAITLTRIFQLTWDHANLVREITTPNLPAFVSTCLLNILNDRRCSTEEFQTVLEAFATLIPRHNTIFRPHENQIRSLLLSILATTPSSGADPAIYLGHTVRTAAHRLLVLLHHCAPKQGSAEKWNDSLRSTITAAQKCCDLLFRSVIEQSGSASKVEKPVNAHHEMRSDGEDGLGLAAWQGLSAGAERLQGLLSVISAYVESMTGETVAVSLGLIVTLLTRVLRVTLPRSNGDDSQHINHQIPREEREMLYSTLPIIHATTIDLATTMLKTFGRSMTATLQPLLEALLQSFSHEKSLVQVRTSTYAALGEMLNLIGPSMTKEDVSEIVPVIAACCEDLIQVAGTEPGVPPSHTNGTADKLTDNAAGPSPTRDICTHPTQLMHLHHEANLLLPILFFRIQPHLIPRKVRAQMERTAVLTSHKEALVACTLCPARMGPNTSAQTSLLPLLAQLHPDSSQVEALLRPRLPVVSSRHAQDGDDFDVDDEYEQSADRNLDRSPELFTPSGTPRTDTLQDAGTVDVNADEHPRNGHINGDDLYSATPLASLRPTVHGAAEIDSTHESTKRAALEEPEESMAAKRHRASTSMAEALDADFISSLPEPDPPTLPTAMPVLAEDTEGIMQTTAVEGTAVATELAQASTANPAVSCLQIGATHADFADEDSDDDDFEIPPLHLGFDTDGEEDGDEDET